MIRRQPDLLSLLFGAVFVGVGITVITGRTDTLADSHWVWPAVLVAVGAIMLAATVGAGRTHRHSYAGPPVQPPAPAAPEDEPPPASV